MKYLVSLASHLGHRALLPDSFTVALVTAGVMTGLLGLAGGAFLERTSTVAAELWEGCVVLQVGGGPGDSAHIRLENNGPETVHIHAAWTGTYGGDWPTLDQHLRIDPWAAAELQFSVPEPGATVLLRSSVKNLYTSTEIDHANGSAPDTRYPFMCRDHEDLSSHRGIPAAPLPAGKG